MGAKAWAILMVLSAIQIGASQQSANPAVGIPEEVGIYAVLQGQAKEVPSETVEAHRGGMFGLNGKIPAPRSLLRLSTPQEFIIKAAEGFSASEYRLLKLDQKKDHRQFRALTVHVGGAADNASKNSIPFNADALNNRTWRVRVDLVEGEYAFFSPQVHSEGLGRSLAYTFGVDSSSGSPSTVKQRPSDPADSNSGRTTQSGISASLGVNFGRSKQGGVEITGFLPESPLQAAGLHIGDVIKTVDTKPVRTAEEFEEVVAQAAGTDVRISYVFLESKMWWVQRDVNVHLTK